MQIETVRILLRSSNIKRLARASAMEPRILRLIRDGKRSPTLAEVDTIVLAQNQLLIEAEAVLPMHLSRRGVAESAT